MHIICSKKPSSLVRNLAVILDAKLTQNSTECFSNQEFFVKLPKCLKKVLIEFPKYHSVNDSIIELTIMLEILSSYDLESLTLLIPYMPYSRQDKQNSICESFGLKALSTILNNFNINRIITFDLHSAESWNLFKAEMINLMPHIIFQDSLKNHKPSDVIVMSTDEGGAERARLVAEFISCDYIVTKKVRSNNTLDHIIKEINHEKIIIVDDIIDSGKTMINIVNSLENYKIDEIYIYVTHILSLDSLSALEQNPLVKKIFTTTEIEDSSFQKVRSIDISDLVYQIQADKKLL